MNLPTVNEWNPALDMIREFRGYDHRPVILPGEWYAMENLTSAHYPLMAPRQRRTKWRTLTKPNGLFAREKLMWVDGTDFYYNGYPQGTVEDSKKQFVAMGAYILIFPDKVYFNTDTAEFGSLEHKTVSHEPVSYVMVKGDGREYPAPHVGDTAPENPESGDTWVDTSASPHVLKVYGTDMWLSAPTTATRITSKDIGKGYRKGDGVTLSGSKLPGMNGDFVLLSATDDSVTVTALIDEWTSQGTDAPITLSREVPDMDYVVELDNRLWGCSSANHEIYASKLGDPFNWRVYEGISTDSYAASVGTPGPFTAAASHLGYVLFFKEDVIHKVYGTKPANFQIVTTRGRGVAEGSHKSVATVQETLYYHSAAGICAYDGSLPRSVSEVFGDEHYESAVAGALGDKYYAALMKAGSSNLFVYDAAKGLWHREDGLDVMDFAALDNRMYALTKNGEIWELTGAIIGEGSGERSASDFSRSASDFSRSESDFPKPEGPVSWFAETGDLGLETPMKKTVLKLILRLTMAADAYLKVLLEYDSGLWEERCLITTDRPRSFALPILPRRCDRLRLRLEGRGEVRLYSLAKVTEEGSEL